MGHMITAHRITLEKPYRKVQLWRQRCRCKNGVWGVRNGFYKPWIRISGVCKYNYRVFYAVSGARFA